MSASILVAYATRAGSTQEVAETVTATLRETGLAVDIRPLRTVDSLEGYKAVVIGAPLYMFRWHKDALGFLKRHQGALSGRPLRQSSLSAPTTTWRRNGMTCARNWTKRWQSSPGSHRLRFKCSAASSIQPHTPPALQPAAGHEETAGIRHPGLGRDRHLGERTGAEVRA